MSNLTITPSNFNPASVAITGGTIDGTIIGGSTPAAGTFTTVQATTYNIGASGPTLVQDAAAISAFKNGTTAQTLRVYGTTTGPKFALLQHTGSAANVGDSAAVALNLLGGVNLTINTVGIYPTSGTGTASLGQAATGFSKLYIDYTNTGTVGAVTINKAAGRVNIAAAGSSVVVTNSFVTAASHVMVIASTADATARVTSVVPAAGSFTINTVATTAQTSFDFFVINAD
jgi:hypothetical protein